MSLQRCVRCGKTLVAGELRIPYANGSICGMCYMEAREGDGALNVEERSLFILLIKKKYYTAERYDRAMKRLQVSDEELFAFYDKDAS